MKNKILIGVVLAIVSGGLAWVVMSSSHPQDKIVNDQATTTSQDLSSGTSSDETVIIPSDKPSSLNGVEIVTSKNKFFEITFPKAWKQSENTRTDGNTGAFYYSVTPDIISPSGIPEGILNPQFSIDVESTDKKSIQPDPSAGEGWVVVNGQRGVFFSGEGVDAYFFLHNNKQYSVRMVRLPDRYNVSEDEALWVLSTFKIAE